MKNNGKDINGVRDRLWLLVPHCTKLLRTTAKSKNKRLASEAIRILNRNGIPIEEPTVSQSSPSPIISPSSLLSSIASDSLPYFIRSFWHTVEEESNPLSWNWHLDEICELLTLARDGEEKRIIITVPPGTMKSLTCSVFFNAWVWATNPSTRFFAVSYNPDISTRDNNNVKKIVTSPLYQRLFWQPKGVSLSSRIQAVERISTSQNGYRIASSVQGGMTGEHPDFIILDDLLKGQDVYSEAKIQQAANFIDSTVFTRQAKDPTIILIMQRLHQNDPAGHMISKMSSLGSVRQVCFPMKFETKRVDDNDPRIIPDPRDHRTEEGELLWPDKFPAQKVHEMEIFLGPLASGQLQQYPIPAGGALFKRDYFTFVDEVPIDARRCRGWDIAESEGSGDETWGVKVAYTPDGILYIEDAVWDQVILTDKLIKSIAEMDGRSVLIREGSGSGKAVTKARSILLAGWDYGVSPETESKPARANNWRSQCQAGNVRIKRGDWNEPYLNRVCSFPFGRYDDPVDATSNAVNELLGNMVVEEGVKGKGLTW